MAEENISCPYCGEYIKSVAKKCRFCGEWLAEVEGKVNTDMATHYATPATPIEVASVAEHSGTLPVENANAVPANPVTVNPIGNVENMTVTQVPPHPGAPQQPVVVNVMNQQTVEQKVEQSQTVIVAGSGSSEGAPGWFYGEILLIAGIVGFVLESWWWFFGALVGGSILISIPFIGQAICVLLGLGWGALAGFFAYGLFSSTSAGWVVGILVAIGAVFGHIEARQKHIEEE